MNSIDRIANNQAPKSISFFYFLFKERIALNPSALRRIYNKRGIRDPGAIFEMGVGGESDWGE